MAAEHRVVGANLLLVAPARPKPQPFPALWKVASPASRDQTDQWSSLLMLKVHRIPCARLLTARGTIADLPFNTDAVWAIDPRNGRSLTKTMTLSQVQPRSKANFAFGEAGSIDGEVVDGEDQLVADANVGLFIREYVDGVLTMRSKGRARTDISVHYRLCGIEPDQSYYLDVRMMEAGGKGPRLIRAWYPTRGTAPAGRLRGSTIKLEFPNYG